MNAVSQFEEKFSPANVSGRVSTSIHEEHARLIRIRLSHQVIEQFLEETNSIDIQQLQYVPYLRFCIADSLRTIAGAELQSIMTNTVLDREFGGFTIGLEGLTEDESDFVKFGTAIGHLLGPANHDAMSNSYYARFTVQHTDCSDSYLRQAYRLFSLHTDGTFVDEATEWLLMMKFAEKNAVGGESRILHLDDWQEIAEFSQSPLGHLPIEYRAPGSKNVDCSVERPLFYENSHGLCMSFIDQFAQPKTIEQANFLSRMSQSLESSNSTTEISLPLGDLIVLNNYFWLHGRAAFEPNHGLHRELMRQRGSFAPGWTIEPEIAA